MSRPMRSCATCGAVFAVPANNPHRRYCAPRCRVADWRLRHLDPGGDADGDAADPAADSVGELLPGSAVTTAAPSYDATAPPYDATAVPGDGAGRDDGAAGALGGALPGAPVAAARCPHCGRPVAVIALLVPPAAAHVRPPEARHG